MRWKVTVFLLNTDDVNGFNRKSKKYKYIEMDQFLLLESNAKHICFCLFFVRKSQFLFSEVKE